MRALESRAGVVGILQDPVTYAFKRWPHRAAYAKVGNGRILMDQNPIERLFGPAKIGLRNWLFVGRPEASWRSAVVYSALAHPSSSV